MGLGRRSGSVTVSCPSCGAALGADWRFCRSCGSRADAEPAALPPDRVDMQPDRCASCEADLVAEALFCHRCGATVAKTALTTESEVRRGEEIEGVGGSPAEIDVGAEPARGPASDIEAGAEREGGTEDREDASVDLEPDASEQATTVLAPKARAPFPRAPGVADQERSTQISANREELAHQCGSCGAELAANARFCRRCGAAQAPVAVEDAGEEASLRAVTTQRGRCPGCRAQIEDWAAFCRHCGYRLLVPASPDGAEESRRCSICGAPDADGSGLCQACRSASGR
jgi:predicted amidophosphoribosyltransferase